MINKDLCTNIPKLLRLFTFNAALLLQTPTRTPSNIDKLQHLLNLSIVHNWCHFRNTPNFDRLIKTPTIKYPFFITCC